MKMHEAVFANTKSNRPSRRMDRYLARVKRFIALLSLTFAFPALVDCAVPAQSTPIALSGDDTLLASVNPDSKSLSLFNVSANIPKKLAEISTGLEPSSVALHPNGRFAYVANAGDGTVAVIDLATRKKTRLLKAGRRAGGSGGFAQWKPASGGELLFEQHYGVRHDDFGAESDCHH